MVTIVVRQPHLLCLLSLLPAPLRFVSVSVSFVRSFKLTNYLVTNRPTD